MQVYGPATGPTTGPSTWSKKPALSNRASMLELPCWHRKTRFRRTKIARFTFLGQFSLKNPNDPGIRPSNRFFFHQCIKDAGHLNDSALSRFWGFDVLTKPITSGTKRWLTTHPHHGMMWLSLLTRMPLFLGLLPNTCAGCCWGCGLVYLHKWNGMHKGMQWNPPTSVGIGWNM